MRVPRELLASTGPFVLAKLALQLAFASGYGTFRDELYYLACAKHLDWGYVDHPPLCVLLLRIVHETLGDSRLAWRLLPALAGAAVVWLSGVLARQMGGGPVAQALAAIAALAAPEYLALDHFYSMNAFEPLAWTAAACLLARLLASPRPGARRDWLLLGLVLGLGLENKLSVLWLVGGLGAGLLATPHRRRLLDPGPWLAFGLAALLIAPHVAWQIAHGWPTAEFMRHATEDKMGRTPPLAFVLAQVMDLQPLSALLWIPGLVALLSWRRLAPFRPFGVAYVAILVLLLAQRGSRTGYLAPAYPMLFAAGGVVAEAATLARPWIARAYGVLLLAGGAVAAPLALPCLPIDRYIGYAKAFGQEPHTEEKKEVGPLSQFYADMFGWPEMTQAVLDVVATLTPEERARAVVLGNDYGQAGAFQFFGEGRGMPPVASGHNNFWLWGPGNPDADVVIRVSNRPEAPAWFAEQFAEVEPRGRFDHPYVMPYENHLVVYVCRHPRVPLGASWPERKHFD